MQMRLITDHMLFCLRMFKFPHGSWTSMYSYQTSFLHYKHNEAPRTYQGELYANNMFLPDWASLPFPNKHCFTFSK